MSGSNASRRGLNILCIDGGGVRGLSALLLLEELMKRIQQREELESPPSPHQYFDLIAGTGTGAIQACMLGRLGMPVRSAIESYANLAKEVFSERKWMGSGTFKTAKLKESLVKIVQNETGNPDEPMIEINSPTKKCRTLVFAMPKYTLRASMPTAFRSYASSVNEGPRCTIWETLCATMAHPELFKSFDIIESSLKQSFVDAGLGCSNPLAHVLMEVKSVYPKRHVSTIMSLGTGHTRTIQIPDRSLFHQIMPAAAIEAMKGIAEDAEKVAEDMARRFGSASGIYYRLSVDQGLQSVEVDKWDRWDEVAEHTRAYMKIYEVVQTIDKAADTIGLRRGIVPTTQIDGQIQLAMAQNSNTNAVSAVRNCPTPTSVYTGNKLKLDQTESCIAWSAAEQIVCVVHGLGGSGKTQLVLKVIERTRHKWKEVIYIDASTQRSIHDALKDVAIAKKIGNTHQSALRWLESNHSPWLLVFDGADDSSVPMRDYIPRGNHGSVIITTRLSGMVALARGPNSDCKMSSMEPEDALTLLLKCARRLDHDICDEEESARTLVKDLDYFALAVVHAGSFIGQYPHITITNYRSLLQSEQQKALGAYSNLASAVKVDDYPHTVYTAWAMCYNAISPPAQELLRLMAYLHHTGITVDIFRRAATTIMSYKSKLPSTRSEDIALKKLRTLLGPLITSYQVWDGLKFTQIIGEVVSRSLLEYDRMNQAYRMHQLVQSWVRGAAPYGADLAAECARTLLSVSASSCVDESLESIMFRMSLILHVDKVVPEPPKRMGVNHAVELYDVYATKGQWKKAERLQIYVQEVCKRTLGKEHPDTLASMGNLANAYSRLGRFEDARALHTQAVNTRNRVLGRNHPDTLTSMSNLANVYSRLGRLKDAKDLNARVLNIRRPMLGSDHPDTLASMNGLANAYSKLGRNEDARALHAQALDTRKRVLGNDHPETLASMNNLANAYSWLRRSQDAMVMHNEVFDARNRVLGSDHPDTLASMNNLANAYSWLGRLEDATALHTRALDTRKRVLGNEHPDTLTSMNNLANACAKMGQFEAAAALHSQALHTRKRELGRTHPDTLRSVVNLSNAYTSLGRLKDAMVLHVEGLNACEQILGSSHPDTLASMDNLGLAYSRLGRFEDATALYTQALYRRERALGSDHHRTLSYALHLAHQYLNLGLIQEARNLNISVDTFVRLYGENHPMTNSARNIVRKIQDPPENPIRRLFGKFKSSLGGL